MRFAFVFLVACAAETPKPVATPWSFCDTLTPPDCAIEPICELRRVVDPKGFERPKCFSGGRR